MRRRGEMEDGKEGRTDKGRGGGREGRRETKKGRDIDMIRIHVILIKIVVTSKFPRERGERVVEGGRERWREVGRERVGERSRLWCGMSTSVSGNVYMY